MKACSVCKDLIHFDSFNKGQLISKCLFGVFNFLQKTNKNKSHSSKIEFFCSFFGGNVGLKKSFWFCLTFSEEGVVYTCYVVDRKYLHTTYYVWGPRSYVLFGVLPLGMDTYSSLYRHSPNVWNRVYDVIEPI